MLGGLPQTKMFQLPVISDSILNDRPRLNFEPSTILHGEVGVGAGSAWPKLGFLFVKHLTSAVPGTPVPGLLLEPQSKSKTFKRLWYVISERPPYALCAF